MDFTDIRPYVLKRHTLMFALILLEARNAPCFFGPMQPPLRIMLFKSFDWASPESVYALVFISVTTSRQPSG
jgi:hypothetical protein